MIPSTATNLQENGCKSKESTCSDGPVKVKTSTWLTSPGGTLEELQLLTTVNAVKQHCKVGHNDKPIQKTITWMYFCDRCFYRNRSLEDCSYTLSLFCFGDVDSRKKILSASTIDFFEYLGHDFKKKTRFWNAFSNFENYKAGEGRHLYSQHLWNWTVCTKMNMNIA